MCFAISGFQSWLMGWSAKPVCVGSNPTPEALWDSEFRASRHDGDTGGHRFASNKAPNIFT